MSTRKAKRQGTIEPPDNLIKTTREKVFVEGKINNSIRKKVMIITTYETAGTITIYIGSRDIYCIDVQLLKNKDLSTVTTGYLTKARWDSVCSIDEPFSKGSDTILMIKLLINYINDKYPDVKELKFNDMSTKTCDDGNSVSLAAMKLLTDGKTWYESHFDIKLNDISDTLYKQLKTDITNKKKEISFDNFSMYSNINFLNIPDSELRELYNKSNTWQEFFSEIRNIIGVSKLCIWLSKNNWFDIFLNIFLKINISTIQFLLNIKQYNEITYKLMNMNGGKYRLSSKKRR